ncbi:MAG: hypothetical protein R3E53_05510 [Myxococcota bacterium]
MSDERILVFDTTLRDGEQSPGCSMNLHEALPRQLERLGVDVIRRASRSTRATSRLDGDRQGLERASVCGLAPGARRRARRGRPSSPPASPHPRQLRPATSTLEHKLRMGASRCSPRSTAPSRGYVDDVEFSAEDAERAGS